MSAPGPGHGAGGSDRLGYLEVLAAASLWGSSGIFSVALFRRGMAAPDVALLRPWFGLVFLLAGAWLFRRSAFRVPARGLWAMAGIGGVATAVFQVAYQMSTEAVGVPTTVALLYLAPAVVLAAAGPVLGERPTRRQVGLAAVSVVGVWLTVIGGQGVSLRVQGPDGLAWGVLAGLSFAAYTLLGRYAAPRWGSVATVLHATWSACLLLALAVPFVWGAPSAPPGAGATGLLAAYGLLTIAAAAFLFYDALGRIPAGHVAIVSTAEPVVAALLATLLVGQGLEPLGWVGLVLVVIGVAGASARRVRPREARA